MRFHRVSIATGDHLQTILSWERSESRGSAWNTQRFHRSASTKHNRVKSEVHFPDENGRSQKELEDRARPASPLATCTISGSRIPPSEIGLHLYILEAWRFRTASRT